MSVQAYGQKNLNGSQFLLSDVPMELVKIYMSLCCKGLTKVAQVKLLLPACSLPVVG